MADGSRCGSCCKAVGTHKTNHYENAFLSTQSCGGERGDVSTRASSSKLAAMQETVQLQRLRICQACHVTRIAVKDGVSMRASWSLPDSANRSHVQRPVAEDAAGDIERAGTPRRLRPRRQLVGRRWRRRREHRISLHTCPRARAQDDTTLVHHTSHAHMLRLQE